MIPMVITYVLMIVGKSDSKLGLRADRGAVGSESLVLGRRLPAVR